MLLCEDRIRRWVDAANGKLMVGEFMESFNACMAKDSDEYLMSGSTAIIEIVGPLSYKYDFWSWLFGGASYVGLMQKVRNADRNPDVTRIVLLMDTPGGEVTGITETSKAIRGASKPTVAFVDPLCASAGLWIASQANQILSVESGEIGSLGVQTQIRSYAKMLEDEGIDWRIIRAKISPDKNLGHPIEPVSDRAVEERQKEVDKWGERFVDAVATGRKVTRETVLGSFGQGRMLDADEALSVGLIDDITTLADLLSEAKRGRTNVRQGLTEARRRRA